MARTISDDATICYLQNILVDPAFQKSGAGRALLETVLARYRHVRQLVLITDNEPGQRAFYEASASPRVRISDLNRSACLRGSASPGWPADLGLCGAADTHNDQGAAVAPVLGGRSFQRTMAAMAPAHAMRTKGVWKTAARMAKPESDMGFDAENIDAMSIINAVA